MSGDGVVPKNIDTSRVQDEQDFLTSPRLPMSSSVDVVVVVGWISSVSGSSITSLVTISVTIQTLEMSDSWLCLSAKVTR